MSRHDESNLPNAVQDDDQDQAPRDDAQQPRIHFQGGAPSSPIPVHLPPLKGGARQHPSGPTNDPGATLPKTSRPPGAAVPGSESHSPPQAAGGAARASAPAATSDGVNSRRGSVAFSSISGESQRSDPSAPLRPFSPNRRAGIAREVLNSIKHHGSAFRRQQRQPDGQEISAQHTAPSVVFGVTADDLSALVSFDHRDGEALEKQLAMLAAAPFNGICGLAEALRTDPVFGLPLASEVPTRSLQGMKELSLSSGILNVSPVDGGGATTTVTQLLDVAYAEERRAAFGINLIPAPPSETILQMVWGTIVEDPILKILIAGATVTLIVGIATSPEHGWVDGFAILVAVVIVLTVTAGNDYSKEKKFKKLLLLSSDKKTKRELNNLPARPHFQIVRGGRRDQISSWDLLAGDLVELAIGDEIPADGIYVRGNRLVVDESPLTGESIPVSEGTAEMLVTGVGPRSTGGKIQELLSETQKEETPLQLKLKDVAVLIGKVGFPAGIATFIALIIRWAINLGTGRVVWETMRLKELIDFFVVAVTVVVVAVPEGLPLAVTISLAFSMFKMVSERCFVRHLAASETMGQATCICTDKTGTLTENRMTVVKVLAGDFHFAGEGAGTHIDSQFTSDTFPASVRDLLCESICLNSSCFLKYVAGKTVFVGSPTEGALLLFSEKLGVEYQRARDSVKTIPSASIAFDSGRKRMSTTVRPVACAPEGPSEYRLYVKGASEIVFALCKRIIVAADPLQVRALTEEDTQRIHQTIKDWAAEGLRTIVTAYKNMDQYKTDEDMDFDLTFISLMGVKDPVRAEVPDAVARCQRAGIVVRMVTGDNILTASKIARECGILNEFGAALEGPVFRAMSPRERADVIPRLQVLARSSPHDKLILVHALRSMGEVVAVTGDGTNDAPALKEADVGFAMGISGTQIAMNACDIILLDDNFATIFLQFQLSVNLVAISITFVGSVAIGESPLSAVELLWVNLIMDTLGALALASEEPDPDILVKTPHSRSEKLINKNMFIFIAAQTTYQMAALLTLLGAGNDIVPVTEGKFAGEEDMDRRLRSLIFSTFVFLQVVNEFCARHLYHQLNPFAGITRSRLFTAIMVFILLIQVLMVQFASGFVGSMELDWQEWLCCAFI
ncbi:MAG: hypothetical protein BJ554DRAFT_806, partial [Olpidium bornovanus]